MKEVALKILNNGHLYITLSVITRFFPVDPDVWVIMELQCIKQIILLSQMLATHHAILLCVL